MDPSDMRWEIHSVGMPITATASRGNATCSSASLVTGTQKAWSSGKMEVCKLLRTSLNWVQYKQISEKSIAFKNIASKIANEIYLQISHYGVN